MPFISLYLGKFILFDMKSPLLKETHETVLDVFLIMPRGVEYNNLSPL